MFGYIVTVGFIGIVLNTGIVRLMEIVFPSAVQPGGA
jgi:hypothetical protein